MGEMMRNPPERARAVVPFTPVTDIEFLKFIYQLTIMI